MTRLSALVATTCLVLAIGTGCRGTTPAPAGPDSRTDASAEGSSAPSATQDRRSGTMAVLPPALGAVDAPVIPDHAPPGDWEIDDPSDPAAIFVWRNLLETKAELAVLPAAGRCIADPIDCNEDYLALPARLGLQGSAFPGGCEALRVAIDGYQDRPEEPPAWIGHGWFEPEPEAGLPAQLMDQVSWDLLVSKTSVRDLRVVRLWTRHGGVSETRLAFFHEALGLFGARLLNESALSSRPLLLALPGHDENSGAHRDLRYGRTLAASGWPVLILDLRAYDGSRGPEDAATLELLCHGTSLLAVRAREAVLASEWIHRSFDGCSARHLVIGHSGGSGVATLLARLDPKVAAVVTDMTPTFTGLQEHRDESGNLVGKRLLTDDHHPGLARLATRLNSWEDVDIPHLELPYGFLAPAREGVIPDPRAEPRVLLAFARRHGACHE